MNKTIIFFCTIFICNGFFTPVNADQHLSRRVISLSPIITETIYLVGGEEFLIANTSYCTMPEAAKYKKKIGSVTQMNVEKIISLRPDLVIASALSSGKQLKILEKHSINLLKAENPRTFEQMCEMTMRIGEKLDRKANARTIVNAARVKANHVMEMTHDLDKPSVFLQIGLKPLHSANKEMFINEYIRYAGGFNIAENEPSGVYSREKVLAKDPEIILIATMGSSKKAGQIEKQRWTAFKSMRAVKKNRVHVLDPELICSPTPVTFVKGLEDILPLIHPELVPKTSAGSGK